MPAPLASLSCFLVPCNLAALWLSSGTVPILLFSIFVVISTVSCFQQLQGSTFLSPVSSSSSVLFCEEACVRTGRLRRGFSEGPTSARVFVLVPEDAFCSCKARHACWCGVPELSGGNLVRCLSLVGTCEQLVLAQQARSVSPPWLVLFCVLP